MGKNPSFQLTFDYKDMSLATMTSDHTTHNELINLLLPGYCIPYKQGIMDTGLLKKLSQIQAIFIIY